MLIKDVDWGGGDRAEKNTSPRGLKEKWGISQLLRQNTATPGVEDPYCPQIVREWLTAGQGTWWTWQGMCPTFLQILKGWARPQLQYRGHSQVRGPVPTLTWQHRASQCWGAISINPSHQWLPYGLKKSPPCFCKKASPGDLPPDWSLLGKNQEPNSRSDLSGEARPFTAGGSGKGHLQP
jgi:hypothetical protein